MFVVLNLNGKFVCDGCVNGIGVVQGFLLVGVGLKSGVEFGFGNVFVVSGFEDNGVGIGYEDQVVIVGQDVLLVGFDFCSCVGE